MTSAEIAVDIGGGDFRRNALVRARAANLLRLAERLPPSTAPETVTVFNGGNTSLLMGVAYTGGWDFRNPVYFQPVGAPTMNVNSGVLNDNGGSLYASDAPQLEFWMRAGKWELWIDGVQANGSPFTSPGDGYKLITFPSARVRILELRFVTTTGNITCAVVRKEYSIWPIPANPRFCAVGDSLTKAVSFGGVTAPSEPWISQFGRMANLDTWNHGVAESGYTVGATFDSRVNLVPVDTPAIGFFGGINDLSANTSTLRTAVTNTIGLYRSRCPDAFIMVNGPFRSPGRNPSQAISDAIKNGFLDVADKKMFFVDTFAENWQFGIDNGIAGYKQTGDLIFTGALVAATAATLTVAWPNATGSYTIVFDTGALKTATLTQGSTAVSWSGAITAGVNAYGYTAAAGNSGQYMVDDTIHFGIASHKYIAHRIRQAWIRGLKTILGM